MLGSESLLSAALRWAARACCLLPCVSFLGALIRLPTRFLAFPNCTLDSDLTSLTELNLQSDTMDISDDEDDIIFGTSGIMGLDEVLNACTRLKILRLSSYPENHLPE